MMRQSEFKMKLDPVLGKYKREHIYGEGMMDRFKSFGKKTFSKTMKKTAKKSAEKSGDKLLKMTATKTGEYTGKKAGDKIVQALSKEKVKSTKKTPTKKVTFNKKVEKVPYGWSKDANTQKEAHDRVLSIISGGSKRKRKII